MAQNHLGMFPREALKGEEGLPAFLYSSHRKIFYFFYPAQKSILGLTTSHTETLSLRGK